MLTFIPLPLIDNKPRNVTVQLPTTWLAGAFINWLNENAESFADYILANEGVYVGLSEEADDEMRVVFVIDEPKSYS